MRRVSLLILATLGCGDTSGPGDSNEQPPFYVGGGIVSFSWIDGACEIVWHAKANDPRMLVTYEVGADEWRRGTFRDSVQVQFTPQPGPVLRDPLRVSWTFASGSYVRTGSTEIHQDPRSSWCGP